MVMRPGEFVGKSNESAEQIIVLILVIFIHSSNTPMRELLKLALKAPRHSLIKIHARADFL